MANPYLNIVWQTGTVAECGVNGCQVDDVIVATIDRLRALSTVLPCKENLQTVKYLLVALGWQEMRTRRREAEGIEGKEVEHEQPDCPAQLPA